MNEKRQHKITQVLIKVSIRRIYHKISSCMVTSLILLFYILSIISETGMLLVQENCVRVVVDKVLTLDYDVIACNKSAPFIKC